MEVRMFDEQHMRAHKRWREMSKGQKILAALKGLGLVVVLFALGGLAVMLLWNAVMSRVLGLAAFGYWQALGLLVLFRVLLGGRAGPFIGRMRMRRLMRERVAEAGGESGEGKDD